jgi:hypothetical protein
MFVVSEADAAAIRTVFKQDGELSAAIELRRRFPGIPDNEQARACVRTIAGWRPLPTVQAPRLVTPSNPAAPASRIPCLSKKTVRSGKPDRRKGRGDGKRGATD